MIDKETLIAIQCASTRRALERKKEDDEAWLNRPIPKEAQRVKEDGSVDLNLRAFTKEELSVCERARYLAGERLELIHAVRAPQVIPSEEKRQKAIDRFMGIFSIDAIKAKFRSLMHGVKTQDYAEMVAEQVRKLKDGH